MKMKTVAAVGAAASLAAGSAAVHAGADNESDIKVVLPPELSSQSVTSPPGAVAEAGLRHRLLSGIPHATGGHGVSTLGQLAKLCGAVVVGHVQEIRDVAAVDSRNSSFYNCALTLSSVSNLLEGQIASPLSVNFHKRFLEMDAKPGDDVVLFLSPDELRFEWGSVDFDFEKKPSGQSGRLSVLGEGRGILALKGPRGSDEVFNAVKQYIDLLRKSPRNADAYYEFLKRTARSQNERLRRDGNSDLLYFLRSCAAFDLNRVIDDNGIDDNVKEYVRLVLLPDRKN
jgi:hypothetical protein